MLYCSGTPWSICRFIACDWLKAFSNPLGFVSFAFRSWDGPGAYMGRIGHSLMRRDISSCILEEVLGFWPPRVASRLKRQYLILMSFSFGLVMHTVRVSR